MGQSESSHITTTVDQQSCNVRGRKTNNKEFVGLDPTETTERNDEDFASTDEDDEMMDIPLAVMEEEEESEDEEEEEEMYDDEEERERILEEVNQLKMMADFYLHPEKPVEVEATASARCFFDRPSAALELLEDDAADEGARILQDAMTLKKLAVDYMHPELPVETTDHTACARCFFDRASAPEQETVEDAEEAMYIMTVLRMLRNRALDYAHPELPVINSDPTAFGRNYFERASAPEPESLDDAEEVDRILEDAIALKKTANDYLHPELPVVTADPTAFGRNYFERPSAYEQEDADEEDMRRQVFADAAALKKLAVDYFHPEMPVVTTDPAVFGRNYFTRPSAPDQEEIEEEDERETVLADAMALKKLSMDYLHPEMSVDVDPAAFGRNYFTRPSALEQENDEERTQVLAEVAALKKLAVDYLHPELPVDVVDRIAFGRNYFTRPSAPEQEDLEEERQQVLAEMATLKELAVDYLHPELPVVTKDATAFGRNYFTRPSAPEQEDFEDGQVLTDIAALKKLAVDYCHPELPVVTTDSTAFGRNYFTRPSAADQEALDEQEELGLVMEDLAALKKKAIDYMHPELPVVTTDFTACGRNFFSRLSAEQSETFEEAQEHDSVLADVTSLKKVAMDYMHPEKPVVVTDPTACGRNFFSRPSAPQYETVEDADEMAQVLLDVAQLKKAAVDYAHPETPVVTTDPYARGRNFFDRPSAPEVEDAEELTLVLAEVAAAKKLAVDFGHPELPVITTDPTAFGRNFFTRPSATAQDYPDEVEDRSFSLEESASLKKSAMDYAHPELPCVATDAAATGRNYYNRPSAPGHADYIHSSGYNHYEAKHDMHYCDDSYQEHSDHFDMDEDIWRDMYASLNLPHDESEMDLKDSSTAPNKMTGTTKSQEEEEEGKLSRSPSSVMLFEQGGMEGY